MRLRRPAISTILTVIMVAVVAVLVARGLANRTSYAAEPGQQADPATAFTDGHPNLVAAMFYSAWCSSCAVLDPKLRDIAPEFDGRAVQFVKFDFTMGPNDALADKADTFGVREIYEANRGATGFMALVDRRSGHMLSTIHMGDSKSEIRDTLNEAIQMASLPAPATPSADNSG